MPYVLMEEVPEGMAPADVVPRKEYDAVVTERDELVTQRDGLVSRAETAEKDARAAKQKYADAFLTSASQIKAATEKDVKSESKPHTYEELFGGRDNGVY